jgi:hypothetical protein
VHCSARSNRISRPSTPVGRSCPRHGLGARRITVGGKQQFAFSQVVAGGEEADFSLAVWATFTPVAGGCTFSANGVLRVRCSAPLSGGSDLLICFSARYFDSLSDSSVDSNTVAHPADAERHHDHKSPASIGRPHPWTVLIRKRCGIRFVVAFRVAVRMESVDT